MSDSALQREVEAALNVDPSPQFLARVRTRIATEPVPAAWRFSWTGLAAAAVVAVGAVAVLWTVSRDSRQGEAPPLVVEVPAPVAPVPVPDRTRVPGATAGPAPATPAEAATRRARRVALPDVPVAAATPAGGARAIADAPPFAEVLVSEDEVRAFQKLIAAVGGVRGAPLPREDKAAEPVTLPPVEIAPVIIEPPAQIARIEIGEGQ